MIRNLITAKIWHPW